MSINFALPLQLNQNKRQDRALAAKLALVDEIQALRDEADRARLAQARNGLQQWQSNRARLLHYDSVLLPLSQQRTQAALAAYRGSSASSGGALAAVLEARRAELDTRLDQLRLEMETADLRAQLNHLTVDHHDTPAMPGTAAGIRN